MVEEKTESLKVQNEEIRHISNKLQEAALSKIGFFMNVSHEFRTPLALILGPVSTLTKSSHLSALDKENVNLIERNGHRLLRLTNQLLDTADLERGTLKLKVAQGDVVDYVLQIVHAFDFRADKMDANYQFVTNEAKFICWFDGDKLEKILYNLISNAFKFTEYPAKIRVELKIDRKYLSLNVTDNGIGITKEELSRVFDRFYQVDSKNRRRTGTGIGLNLAKHLAQKHKGDLTVESKQGNGSSFILKIPIDEKNYAETERVQNQPDIGERIDQIQKLSQRVPDSDQIQGSRNEELPTILHIEDSLDMRSFIKTNLQQHFSIFQAKDGVEGLKKAEELVPDLIISDIMMPVMDGIEFCDKIKENDFLSHIPVILLTAKIGEQSQIEGFGVGADEYLSKPIDVSLLKARINNLLASRKKLRDSFSSNIDLVPKDLLQDRSDEVFLEKAVKIVEQNLSDPELNYHAFVKTLGVGKTQLYNRINKISGQSINIFIRTIRLKIAAKLIHEGTMTFSEISYEVGFSDPNYFSKCFKKQYGMSPKAFQEQGKE
jgi:DNA-binding response OmpR family regulator/nitrogen-specific signal transduction histidine kinase